MNSNNRISAPVMLMAASLAFSPSAWSLGLGEAKVDSYLNQPLKARIDLISQASDDLSTVTAGMASAADYELIGASIEGMPVPLRFTVEDVEGDAYIAATSTLPINEPVLRLIVEVNWSSGRLLREYTLFLDPPAVPEAAPAPRIDQRQAAAAQPARQEGTPAVVPSASAMTSTDRCATARHSGASPAAGRVARV
jgi:pilus assembly protein FimV